MSEERSNRIEFNSSMTLADQLLLIARLSVPAILAQISSVVMEYIDASMVGHLGAEQSASIGLIASSTWLLGSLCIACSTGFTVQVAHAVGAGDNALARRICRQGMAIALGLGLIIMAFGAAISIFLPGWLGGEEMIRHDASMYFLVFSLGIPGMMLNYIGSGMLQCSGNMRLPSVLQIGMCVLDVILNMFCIFSSNSYTILGLKIFLPGLGLGVMGAALGTALAELITALLSLYFLLFKSPELKLQKDESLSFSGECLKRAYKLAWPVALENILSCGAQVVSTRIVSPLGYIAIAANSFSVTAEGLCYMPGYGIGHAATTIIGQATGAGEKDMVKRLGRICVATGMLVMAGMGVLMFVFAPEMIGLLTPNTEIRELAVLVLRIEAFAEPMYAASIVVGGVLRGQGDTLSASILNFVSMWIVRLPMAAVMAPRLGLKGVWIAMCVELCVRGLAFLIRLAVKNKSGK